MRTVLASLLAVLTAGCMASLTPAGERVEIVTESRKEQCRSLGVVAGTEAMGHTMTSDALSAMNKTRNRVAALGGNAMYLMSSSSSVFASTVTAEALECPPVQRE